MVVLYTCGMTVNEEQLRPWVVSLAVSSGTTFMQGIATYKTSLKADREVGGEILGIKKNWVLDPGNRPIGSAPKFHVKCRSCCVCNFHMDPIRAKIIYFCDF